MQRQQLGYAAGICFKAAAIQFNLQNRTFQEALDLPSLLLWI